MTRWNWKHVRSRWLATPSPIGVDFDKDRIHWAQVDRTAQGIGLLDACSVKHGGDLEALLSSKNDLRRLIGEVMRRGRFQGRRIVTHAPTEHLRLMVLNYAADDALSEPEQILGLCRERMRDDLLEHVVDYLQIRTSGQQQGDRSALVAVTPEQPVIQHLERLRRAGLEVEALEIAPVAVRRLVATLASNPGPQQQREIALVLRLGATITELTLLSGQRLLLYREIETGTDSIMESVAKGLECEPEVAGELMQLYGVGAVMAEDASVFEFDDPATGAAGAVDDIAVTLRQVIRPSLRGLVDQVHKAISYAAFQTRGTSVEKVYLLESGASCQGLDGLLAEMLQLPVEFFHPLSRLEGAHGRVAGPSDQRIAVALGFAMRGLVDV